ncbi:MAG: hypothetical protein ABR606_21025 [Vicinamibacterales bacterium]
MDDYCPRERRITDHAIVAMVEDKIQQTRCASCDTEHEYKQARVPPQRRKKASPGLVGQVLEGLHPPPRAVQVTDDGDGGHESSPAAIEEPAPSRPTTPAVAESAPAPEPPADVDEGPEDGPVRRPLIRAQLPRQEGQPPPTRVLPDFTVRQSKNGRGNRPMTGNGPPGGPRQGGGGTRRRGSEVQGSGGPSRFGGPRPAGHGRHSGDRSQGPGGWSGNRAERGRGGRGRGGKKR